jgi:hypothetical protein
MFKRGGRGSLPIAGQVRLAPGAVTARLIPEWSEYIVLAPPQYNQSAQVLIFPAGPVK